ncbi:MAG: phospholipase D family protein [Rubrobacteraceae bacterium]
MQLVSREGRHTLNKVLDAANQRLLICAPFITTTEMTRVIDRLQAKADFDEMSVDLITDLRPDSVLAGSLHVQALVDLLNSGCEVKITALARVHAKVYLADTSVAWVTSANLTTAALNHNLEYGVFIEEPSVAADVLRDMNDYARLGAIATRLQIQNYATVVDALRKEYESYRRTSEARFRRQFRQRLEEASVEAIRLQVGDRSAHAVFSDAITFLLRSGPMSTKEMHPKIQALLPELCDDQRDRVIDGRHFGKLWKHHVRTAQQHLKRTGTISYENGVWKLTRS